MPALSTETWYPAADTAWFTNTPHRPDDWLARRRVRFPGFGTSPEVVIPRQTMNWHVVLLPTHGEDAHSATLEDAVRNAYREAAGYNWNGEGGLPVSAATYHKALGFMEALPSHLPTPDVFAHPDGEIAFEWHKSADEVLTLSISGAGDVSFAAMFKGGGRFHGSEHFIAEVPEQVLLALRKLTKD